MSNKNFKVDLLPVTTNNNDMALHSVFDENFIISLPKNPTSTRKLNVLKYKGMGFDPLLPGLYQVLTQAANSSVQSGQKTISISSVCGLFHTISIFGKYLNILSNVLEREVEWIDINRNIVDQFIIYLGQTDKSYGGQKTQYTQAKSLLVHCFNHGLLGHINQARNLFPKNPYPGSNRRKQSQQPYSKQEFKRLSKAMREDYRHIVNGSQPLTGYELSVCIIALGIRTGINTTSTLELPTDCLQPHPLKQEDRMLLVWFKRRGNNTHFLTTRKSDEHPQFGSIQYDVAELIEMVKTRNSPVRERYEDTTRLFVHEAVGGRNKGDACELSSMSLQRYLGQLTDKHSLLDDNDESLKINLSRLRKTFVNRIFELSGQDPLVAARYGRHSIQTANNHYWTPPPEAEADHRKLIEKRVNDLIATDLKGDGSSTPLATCRDTLYGHHAPSNGEHCTQILKCFRCKSFVVTKDDLHKVFSFYWSMIDDRRITDTKTWKSQFRHIRQIIDDNIAPQFDQDVITEIKAKAKTTRYPYWKDLTMLRLRR